MACFRVNFTLLYEYVDDGKITDSGLNGSKSFLGLEVAVATREVPVCCRLVQKCWATV